MSIVKINIGGTGGQLGKFTSLPRLGGALYAGYLLGTDYHAASAFGGTPVDDMSNNARTLAATGGSYNADHMPCASGNFMQAPFTDADLFGSNGCSIITVSASVNGVAIVEAGTFEFPNTGTRGVALAATSDTSKPLTSYNFSGGPQTDLTDALARATGTFEFRAATFSPGGGLVYRQRADITDPQIATNSAAHSIIGSQSVRIGQPNAGSGFGGAVKVAAALFANRALTSAELDDAYTEMKALMANFSVSI